MSLDLYDLESVWDDREEGSEELLRSIPTERLETEGILYRQGNKPLEFALVRRGRLQVTRRAEDGTTTILGVFGPGEPVGALAVINDFPYPATVTAQEESIVYRITADLLPDLQEEAPQWYVDCLGEAAGRVADLAGRFESLRTDEIQTRLARQLLELAEQHGEPPINGDAVNGDGVTIDMSLTREMLADMIGCRVESAIRKMSQWEQDGVIRTQESRITLRDRDYFRRLVSDA